MRKETRTGITSSAQSALAFVFLFVFFYDIEERRLKKYCMYAKFLFMSKRRIIKPLTK